MAGLGFRRPQYAPDLRRENPRELFSSWPIQVQSVNEKVRALEGIEEMRIEYDRVRLGSHLADCARELGRMRRRRNGRPRLRQENQFSAGAFIPVENTVIPIAIVSGLHT